MKKIAFTFIALFLGTFLFAQEKTPAVENKAEITFAKTVNDYGTIEQASNGTCEFEFTNTGKEALTLFNVQASCGCTAPEWSKEPVNPGSKGKIVVKYNTNGIGKFQKSITVYSNAKNNPTILTIKGEVVPKKTE